VELYGGRGFSEARGSVLHVVRRELVGSGKAARTCARCWVLFGQGLGEMASAAVARYLAESGGCDTAFTSWVEAMQRVPTSLVASLNGHLSPEFNQSFLFVRVAAVSLNVFAPAFCRDRVVTVQVKTEADLNGTVLVAEYIGAPLERYEVSADVAGLQSASVFIDGQLLATLEYENSAQSTLLGIVGLASAIGIMLLWLGVYVFRDWLHRRSHDSAKRRAQREQQRAPVPAQAASDEFKQRMADRTAQREAPSTSQEQQQQQQLSLARSVTGKQLAEEARLEREDPWHFTNMLRQRRFRDQRTAERQKKAVEEMKRGAMVKFKVFLPEDPMAVAVWLETSVCHLEDFHECYGVSLFEIAPVIHAYLLKNLRPGGAKGMSWDAPVWRALDQVRDGYFFVAIVATELLLEGFTGSGVFTSQQMVGGTKTLVTVALAVALISVLPFMMSMSRNASPYIYGLVLSALPTVLCRDLTGGLVMLGAGSLVALLATAPLGGAVLGALLMVHCALFGCFMLLTTMLYLFRAPDPHVLLPSGRAPGTLGAVVLVLLLPFVLNRTLPPVPSQAFWVAVHAAALLLADAIMVLRLRSISLAWHMWLPTCLRLASEMKVAKTLKEKLPGLSRAAREEALWIVNRKIPDKDMWKTFPETAEQGFWEYYFMAMEDNAKLAMGTPERRSGELFDGNASEILHSIMYFLILSFSAVPLYLLRGEGSNVSRGVLFALLGFLLTSGTIELFVKEISDAKQKDVHELLIPASKRIVKQAEVKMHAARLVSYGKVICSFQLVALRWSLLAAAACYFFEPAALFVALPFSAGYSLVLYAMISRLFLSGFSDRAHVAVTVALGVGCLVMLVFGLLRSFALDSVALAVALTCMLMRALRVVAMAYAAGEESDTAPTVLSQLLVEVGFSTVAYMLLTAAVAVLGFFCGELLFLQVSRAFYSAAAPSAPGGGSALVASAALAGGAAGGTLLLNLFVYGFSPLTRLVLPDSLAFAEVELLVEMRSVLTLAALAGFNYLFLGPLSLGALMGFVTAATVYAHTMRYLVLQPRNTWHKTIDPNDIPMTSGKKILDGGGLTQVKPEVREQMLADKLRKGTISALPLVFDNGLGEQVLALIESRYADFASSALTLIVPDDAAEPPAGPSSEAAGGGKSKAVAKASASNSGAAARTAAAALEGTVHSLMATLVEECRAGKVFVYLVDGDALYKEGFVALGLRRKQIQQQKEPSPTLRLRPSSLWREQANNRLMIYVSVPAQMMRDRSALLDVATNAQAEAWLGSIAECMIHEFVEDATRSHALAQVSELAMLDARRDGYLPRSVRLQLARMVQKGKMDRVQHVFDNTGSAVSKSTAKAKRLPQGWRYGMDAWVHVCHIEKEIALEIGDFCERLLRETASLAQLCRAALRGQCGGCLRSFAVVSKPGARIWYTALRGDMDVDREVCAYLKHMDLQPWLFSSLHLCVTAHRLVARPLFVRLVRLLAWSCTPLYLQLFAPARARRLGLKEPHKDMAGAADPEVRRAFARFAPKMRPLLFQALAVKDEGQTFVPGVLAAILDECAMLRHPRLAGYWAERARMARGRQPFLKFSPEVEQAVETALEPDTKPMLMNLMCHKAPDLLVMGGPGSSPKTIYKPDPNKVDMIVDGSATIFYVSGGVTTCLVQLIEQKDIAETFNLFVLAETASNSTPRISTPTKCVAEIHPIALHDVTPCPESTIHGAKPYYDLALRKEHTTTWVLRARFHPLLRELIRGCCELQGVDDRSSQVNEYFSEVVVALYEYFEQYDWNASWSDGLTWQVWVQTWLTMLQDKPREVQRLWAPTLPGLSEALVFFSQALRSLVAPLPAADLYHSSHHGIGALKGIVHKQRFKSRLIVWDHGILLRERLDQLCADDQLLNPFTRNAIVGLTRLTARLVYNSADIISPCTSVDMYRRWICLIAGRPYDGPFMKRIRPVSNGTEPLLSKLKNKRIEGYYEDAALQAKDEEPVEDLKHVHCVMLSHVLPIKDVENAIRAAAHIVHKRKMTCYRLHIFGGLDKDPKYVARCKSVLAELKLEGFVTLHGAAMKFIVFPKADLFLNSSFSEGLPMAILEAWMAKCPVVCTDVGGSREVVPNDKMRAPPRDPVSLGDAQILTLCGFAEERDDAKLNALALSAAARAERRRQGEIGYNMATTGFTEAGTYKKHYELMVQCATAAEDPTGDKFLPPPFSVPVSVPINVSVQRAAPAPQRDDSANKNATKLRRATDASNLSSLSHNTDDLEQAATASAQAGAALARSKGSKSSNPAYGQYTMRRAARKAPAADVAEEDSDEELDIEKVMPQLRAKPMGLDLSYVRNIRFGSHVPDDVDDDSAAQRASANRAAQRASANRTAAPRNANDEPFATGEHRARSRSEAARSVSIAHVSKRHGQQGRPSDLLSAQAQPQPQAGDRGSNRLASLMRFDASAVFGTGRQRRSESTGMVAPESDVVTRTDSDRSAVVDLEVGRLGQGLYNKFQVQPFQGRFSDFLDSDTDDAPHTKRK
jgi:glycosyltransferase involved in cell wall biosynthesis